MGTLGAGVKPWAGGCGQVARRHGGVTSPLMGRGAASDSELLEGSAVCIEGELGMQMEGEPRPGPPPLCKGSRSEKGETACVHT